MPVGPILLVILLVAITFGLVDRALVQMRLSPRMALLFTGAALAGNLVDIPVRPGLVLNVGSAVVPLLVVFYLLATEPHWEEPARALAGGLVTATAVFIVGRWFSPVEPTELNLFMLDAQYLFAIVGGLVCWVAAREPRSAFCAAVLGVIGADLVSYVRYLPVGSARPWVEQVGGGGFQDTAIVAALLAVCLVRWIAESPSASQAPPRGKGY